jgi:hypothetical protein
VSKKTKIPIKRQIQRLVKEESTNVGYTDPRRVTGARNQLTPGPSLYPSVDGRGVT